MEGPFEKRVKRHVIGPPHEFFAVTAPGIEALCARELTSLGAEAPISDIVSKPGGVEFIGRLPACYQANLHLRTANRILMRIAGFNAFGFPQLEKKLSEIPWELFLAPSVRMEFKVTCRQSRLYHSTAVAQRCQKAVEERLRIFGVSPAKDGAGPAQTLFVLAKQDHFTISLDSSGELLHKRGYRKSVGRAPIRETLASAILMLAGYTGDGPLIDPMCGSGTFSFEAASIAQNIPPGLFRGFAFEQWPCYRPRRWAHIKKSAGQGISAARKAPTIFASDTDPAACATVRSVIGGHDLFKTIDVAQRNFFDFTPADVTPHRGVVVLNPPYGRRMAEQPREEKMLKEVEKKLKADYRGWKAALITPDRKYAKRLPFPGRTRPLLHGGLHLSLVLCEIP